MHLLRPRDAVLVLGALLVGVVGLTTVLVVTRATVAPTPLPSPTGFASPYPAPSRPALSRPSTPPTPARSASPSPSPTPAPTPVAVCPYTGLPVSDPAVLAGPAFLVQVENHPEGRPVSGFNAADMVVEAPVEGDTTRFTPVFLCGPAPAAIGPVRSARYYNVDLWRELHGIVTHYGAGGAIITEFARKDTPYVNGITGEWPFFSRSQARLAPHNVYLNLTALRAAAARGDLGERVASAARPRGPFVFAAGAELTGGRAVAAVRIFTNSYWNFGWTWDEALARWLRSDGGSASVDALDGGRLNATSVVVQIVQQEALPNEVDASGFPRTRQQLVGSRTGVAYAGGRAVDVRWSRPTVGAATTWTYADSGEPLVLPPGRVWWEIIAAGSSMTES